MSNPTTETSGHRPTNLPEIGKSCPSVPIMSPCSKKQRLPDRIRRENNKPNFTFFISTRDIPENFANIGAIAIPLNSDSSSGNQENHGWYLCGNPFPALLPLTQIEKNKALDGNIYVYDGNGYKTYSLNSNYALPPFAAFFVKASSPTELKISSNSTPTKAINIIPTNFPMSKSIT